MKYIKTSFIFIICFFLMGCVLDDPKYITFKTKPTAYYYSDELFSNIKENNSYTIQVFDCNLYKYYNIDQNDYDILDSFLTSLRTENYLSDFPEDMKNNGPVYRIIVTFDSSKFIINAYSNTLVTIHPYDGAFLEDIIDCSTNVSLRDNIYDFCIYVINKSQTESN